MQRVRCNIGIIIPSSVSVFRHVASGCSRMQLEVTLIAGICQAGQESVSGIPVGRGDGYAVGELFPRAEDETVIRLAVKE